jgi:hypothetical protein
MNKEFFFDKYDKQLTKMFKELPVLEDLNTNYSKQAFTLMIYAHFEGFIKEITKDFYNFLSAIQEQDKKLNAHYNFCLHLYNKPKSDKDSLKKSWNKFIKIKRFCFKRDNNNLIDTNDNIGYDVFKYILFLLNICEHKSINSKYYTILFNKRQNEKPRTYASYEGIINDLLMKRNDIAHGNPEILKDNFLTLEEIKEISNGIMTIFRQLKDDIFDIIEKNTYLLSE